MPRQPPEKHRLAPKFRQNPDKSKARNHSRCFRCARFCNPARGWNLQNPSLKFKNVPKAIEAEIQATPDIQQLDLWLDAFATARSIRTMPFAANAVSQ